MGAAPGRENATANPRMLAVFDARADAVATVPLADVAADIRRYEVLGPAGPAAGKEKTS